MTEYSVDASALVKRSTDEAGSTWIRRLTPFSLHHLSPSFATIPNSC